MAYDEELAERVRGVFGDDPRLHEQKMFGGLDDDDALERWIDRGLEFAGSLPAKR